MESVVKLLKKIAHWLVALGAYWCYGRPGRKLIVIGVTGTKGKTTTTRLIASVLEAGGYNVGLLNTVEFQVARQRTPNKHQMSMLGRGQIQKHLRDMVRAGCQYAVIETSSEGILQYRHLGLCYDIAVFTNLGTEHHERHGGFANLRRDKGKLFAALTKCRKRIAGKLVSKIIVANNEDKNASFFLNFKADKKFGFGLVGKTPDAAVGATNFLASQIQNTPAGLEFVVNNERYYLPLQGDFNVYNALPAIIIGLSQSLSPSTIQEGLKSVTVVAGRMEYIDAGQNFSFIVDYAHEPMSLTALFTALRPLVKPPGKLVGIIGSDGGGRDKTKRGIMGEIAGRLCDIVIVTDVNPWDEDPQEIAEMLAMGARRAGKVDNQDLFIVVDRKQSIKRATELVGAQGVAVITAKGTETSIIGPHGVKTPWDDRAVVRAVLEGR